MNTNISLSPAEIIYLVKRGRIEKDLTDILKLTFCFLVLKGIFSIELKMSTRPRPGEEEACFFVVLNKDKVKAFALSSLEIKLVDFVANIKQDWVSLEQFLDVAASLVSNKFRFFSKRHKIKNDIRKDLLEKELISVKQKKIYNIPIANSIVVSSAAKRLLGMGLKNLSVDDYASIMHQTGINYGDFFEREAYVKLEGCVNAYIDRFLLTKGGWVVAPMALFAKSYPKPLT